MTLALIEIEVLKKNSIGDVKGACLDWKQAIKLGDNISAKWVRAQCN